MIGQDVSLVFWFEPGGAPVLIGSHRAVAPLDQKYCWVGRSRNDEHDDHGKGHCALNERPPVRKLPGSFAVMYRHAERSHEERHKQRQHGEEHAGYQQFALVAARTKGLPFR